MNFNQKESFLYTVVFVEMVIAGFVTHVAPTVWLWKITLKALLFTHYPVACSISICGLIDVVKCFVKHFIRKAKKL